MLHESGEHAHLWHAVNPSGTPGAVPDVAAGRSRRCPGSAFVTGWGRAPGVTHTLCQHRGCEANGAGPLTAETGFWHAGIGACGGGTALVAPDCHPWRAPLPLRCQQVLRGRGGPASLRCCFQLPEGSWGGGPAERRPQGQRSCLWKGSSWGPGLPSLRESEVWGQAKAAAPGTQGPVLARRGEWSGSNVGGQAICLVHWVFLVGGQVEVEEQIIWNWVSKLWWRSCWLWMQSLGLGITSISTGA